MSRVSSRGRGGVFLLVVISFLGVWVLHVLLVAMGALGGWVGGLFC